MNSQFGAQDAPPPVLEFASVTHEYSNGLKSLSNLSFTIEQGEFVAIIGPSGSGKSTIVKIAAGLEQPNQGTIYLNGRDEQRRLGQTAYMPQSDALLPWRTIMENVILGAEVQGKGNQQTRQRAQELMEMFGLAGFEHAYPSQLSGGMRQRAAFLRTFLSGQPVVLLDEPLSALDAITRAELQDWLLEVRQHFAYTIILVTHDIQEAVYLADRIIVLSPRPGTIVDTIEIAHERPRDRSALVHDVNQINRIISKQY